MKHLGLGIVCELIGPVQCRVVFPCGKTVTAYRKRETGIGEHVRVYGYRSKMVALLAMSWLPCESENALSAYEEWLIAQEQIRHEGRMSFRLFYARFTASVSEIDRRDIRTARAIERGEIAPQHRTAGDWQRETL